MEEVKAPEYTDEQLKLLQSQDINYVTYKLSTERKVTQLFLELKERKRRSLDAVSRELRFSPFAVQDPLDYDHLSGHHSSRTLMDGRHGTALPY